MTATRYFKVVWACVAITLCACNPYRCIYETRFIATEPQEIRFRHPEAAFHWQKDERILVEISRKFDPERLQEQLRFFALDPLAHFTDANHWYSVLLFKKRA